MRSRERQRCHREELCSSPGKRSRVRARTEIIWRERSVRTCLVVQMRWLQDFIIEKSYGLIWEEGQAEILEKKRLEIGL